VECLIVLGGPVVAFGFGCKLPLLIILVWANHGHFNKRPEHWQPPLPKQGKLVKVPQQAFQFLSPGQIPLGGG
jgi:hypothetical protein